MNKYIIAITLLFLCGCSTGKNNLEQIYEGKKYISIKEQIYAKGLGMPDRELHNYIMNDDIIGFEKTVESLERSQMNK